MKITKTFYYKNVELYGIITCALHIFETFFKSLATYVLPKALPPVCMKYTARGKSRVANIA